MEYINNVDSEGGPFLLADSTIMLSWRGSDGDGSDYERAYQALHTESQLPGALISVGSEQALVWETEGAGTGDIFLDEQGHLTIIRAWLDESDGADPDDELRTVTALAELPLNEPINLGTLDINSGVLAIFWAAESGECIEALDIDKSERPIGEMTTDSSGLLVKVNKGFYICLHDEVELGEASARRCHLINNSRPTK